MVKLRDYDTVKYWEARGNDYTADCSNIELPLLRLYNFVKQESIGSILDIGSGWGRVYKFFQWMGYNKRYAMCDIARSMTQACKRETGVLPKLWDGKKLTYDRGEFDLSLLVHVLQHCERPRKVLLEAKRVSSRFVAVLDATAIKEITSNHCFHHDWLLLFAKSNLVLEDCAPFYGGSVMLWVLRK